MTYYIVHCVNILYIIYLFLYSYMFLLTLKEIKKKTFSWAPPPASAVANAEIGPGKLAGGRECISNMACIRPIRNANPRPCPLRFRFCRSGVWPRNLYH